MRIMPIRIVFRGNMIEASERSKTKVRDAPAHKGTLHRCSRSFMPVMQSGKSRRGYAILRDLATSGAKLAAPSFISSALIRHSGRC